MRKIAILIALGALLLLGVTPALATNGMPKLPHAFYGSVTINDAAAPNGIQVSATVNIGDIISTQNPVTTAGGSYGISSYLLVQGYDIPDGATITFHVTNSDGTAIADVTATFVAGGGPTQKDLSVTIAVPPPVGGSSAPPAPPPPAQPPVETNIFGTTGSFEISDDGVVQETFTATSEDGNLTITIPEGTVALDKDGDPLESLETAVDESPPAPPEDANIIGLAYDFGPDGATFNPPITLEFTINLDDIPSGLTIDDLVVAYYDETLTPNQWVELATSVVPGTNILRVAVSHFTTFALIGKSKPPAPAPPPPAPPAPPPPPPPAPAPAPTPAPTPPAPTPPAPAPAPPAPTPPPAPAPPASAINWPLVGGLIATAVVVGLIIFFLVRRRA